MKKMITALLLALIIPSTAAAECSGKVNWRERRAKRHYEFIERHGLADAWKKEQVRREDLRYLRAHRREVRRYVANNPDKIRKMMRKEN